LLSKEYAAIKGFHSGELVNRIFSDVVVVQGGLVSIVPSLVYTAVSFVGAAAILIGMDWRFVPVLIASGLVGVGLTVAFRGPMSRRHKRMQAAQDALHANVQETLEHIHLIKASMSEDRAMVQVTDRRARLDAEQLRNGRLGTMMNNGMGAAFDLSWLVCNIWGCVKIAQGQFTYGGLAALIQLIGRIQGPISDAVQLMSEIYGVIASAERLQDVVGLPDEQTREVMTGFDGIALRDVRFQYDDGTEDVLLDVNAEIHKGDFVALTGMSGAGKTSLFQLLLGIYRPTQGEVLFMNGEETVRANRGTRGLFAYVPQGNTLFSGTLRENLTRFADDATDEDIAWAVRAACLEDLVRDIGLDAVLGERGMGLSEGQAQRVAIARALLTKAPILLLDEVTSALDEATEAKLLDNIGAMKDKTMLIVTHRPAALGICTVVWQINDGRLTVKRPGETPVA